MKKVIVLAAFALVGLATSSAHAQSTISPVPGAPDRPHETAPTTGPLDKVSGQMRSDGQMAPNARGQYKGDKMRNKSTMSAKKEARKEMKMQKQANKASTM